MILEYEDFLLVAVEIRKYGGIPVTAGRLMKLFGHSQ